MFVSRTPYFSILTIDHPALRLILAIVDEMRSHVNYAVAAGFKVLTNVDSVEALPRRRQNLLMREALRRRKESKVILNMRDVKWTRSGDSMDTNMSIGRQGIRGRNENNYIGIFLQLCVLFTFF
jgi:hypothetical protein